MRATPPDHCPGCGSEDINVFKNEPHCTECGDVFPVCTCGAMDASECVCSMPGYRESQRQKLSEED